MAKTPKVRPAKAERRPEIELVPDAWPRFERFIREIAKAGPQHKAAPKAGRRQPVKSK